MSKETVPEEQDTVRKTVDIVPEDTESVTLPTEVQLEPQILSLSQQFSWNFDAIKTALAAKIEKYTGLVVNDENLKEMEKTQKEIAGLRTKIGKFKLEVKRELEKPYQQFELQIKELVSLVESVEKPIKDQLEVYENKRRDAKAQMVQGIINELAAEMGLGEKYSSQIVIADKYLNRTTTKKEITEDLQMKVAWYLDIQSQERQAALFKAQKVEMAKLLCQSLSAGLATPLTFEEIESRVDSMQDILVVKAFIEEEVAKRKQREERAAQLAVEQAAPSVPVAPVPPVPISQSVPETTWDVVLCLPGINMQQSVGFQKYLADSGIRYEVVSQQVRSPGDTL